MGAHRLPNAKNGRRFLKRGPSPDAKRAHRSHSSGDGRPPRADAITTALSLQEQRRRDSSAIIGTSKSNAEDEIMFMYRNFCTAARFAASRWSDPTGGWLDRWAFAL
jgi:hypothetical protein